MRLAWNVQGTNISKSYSEQTGGHATAFGKAYASGAVAAQHLAAFVASRLPDTDGGRPGFASNQSCR